MGFVTPALLGGALLVSVPIVLHLIMRREAQQILFPALRFVERRRTLNQHRLRLRHLILLALRCAIIALLAAALARPVLRATGAGGEENAAVATVLVFDNSLRMQYQYENQSRLDQAKELGLWLTGQLPADAPLTLVDRAGRQRGQELDHDAVALRIERLELSSSVRPPEETLNDAADWLAERPDYRGEIYFFTDMSTAAWPREALEGFAQRLEQLPNANVYLIDVGVEHPRNLGLDELRLSSARLSPGGVLTIDTQVQTIEPQADGVGHEPVVEVYVDSPGGSPEKRGQQMATPAPGAPARVEFSLTGLDIGTHQGFARIVGSDALPCDDVRYFTVEVRPPSKILLVGESTRDTLFLREALAPSALGGAVAARFECDEKQFREIAELDFDQYQAVMLADPPALPSAAWQALGRFVSGGGGLGIFLGRRGESDAANATEPQQLLPARLRWRSRDETYLRPTAVEHPALAELRGLADIAPWQEFPVLQYWELEAAADGARVVAYYANGKPALVERLLGRGRVLLMTTSVSDAAHDDPWNLLATGPEPWPFLALSNGIAQYLAGAGDERLNYMAGQTAVLSLAGVEPISNYVLQLPSDGGERLPAVRQSLTPGQQDLSISSTEALGNYRIRAGGRSGGLDRGFSVNCGPEMSQLERVSAEHVADVLGKDRVRTARTRDEIEVRVGLGRVGRELFPALILAVALLLGAEQLLANRFYRETLGAERREAKVGFERGGLAASR